MYWAGGQGSSAQAHAAYWGSGSKKKVFLFGSHLRLSRKSPCQQPNRWCAIRPREVTTWAGGVGVGWEGGGGGAGGGPRGEGMLGLGLPQARQLELGGWGGSRAGSAMRHTGQCHGPCSPAGAHAPPQQAHMQAHMLPSRRTAARTMKLLPIHRVCARHQMPWPTICSGGPCMSAASGGRNQAGRQSSAALSRASRAAGSQPHGTF